MKEIIQQTEEDFDYKAFFYKEAHVEYEDVSSSVAVAAVKTAYSSGAKAIFAITRTGFTTRMLTRLRPKFPVIALTKSEKKYHQLAFFWGVIPIFSKNWENEKQAFEIMSSFAMQNDIISFGDFVVIVSSFPFDKRGITNLMLVESIGNILVRGNKGFGDKTEGKIAIILSLNGDSLEKAKNKILVISKCDVRYLPLFKVAKGVIYQNRIADDLSEASAVSMAQNLNLPIIVGAKHAIDILIDDEVISLDPKKALVFKI
jgi:pyruvate kinase